MNKSPAAFCLPNWPAALPPDLHEKPAQMIVAHTANSPPEPVAPVVAFDKLQVAGIQ